VVVYLINRLSITDLILETSSARIEVPEIAVEKSYIVPILLFISLLIAVLSSLIYSLTTLAFVKTLGAVQVVTLDVHGFPLPPGP